MNAALHVRDKRSTPHNRSATLMAAFNKAGSWALGLRADARAALLQLSKGRANASRVTDRKRKADAAELDKPNMDARIAAKKAKDDKKAAERQAIVDLVPATCWAEIIHLSSVDLLKQIQIYRVVDGNTSIVLSRDASSRQARMLFLGELIVSKYGEAHASAGCTRDHLYDSAQVKVNSAPRARPRTSRGARRSRPVARTRAAPPPRAGATKGAHTWRPASRE